MPDATTIECGACNARLVLEVHATSTERCEAEHPDDPRADCGALAWYSIQLIDGWSRNAVALTDQLSDIMGPTALEDSIEAEVNGDHYWYCEHHADQTLKLFKESHAHA